jgi:NAD(P)-dependent dehydrogenase (short-subunit alcohol dehydrogenase family)
MRRLAGKTALVTGASRGIGRGIAERLGREGAVVAVHYATNEVAANETATLIRAAGGRAFTLRAELGVPGDADTLWRAFDERVVEHAGRPGLDILVNNAGIALYGRVHEVSEPDFDRVFAVNVKAPFFIIQRGLKRMRDGGRIINISSGVCRIAFPMVTAYAMTKGALNTLTLALAQDLGARGITVNAVAPGVVETQMSDWIDQPGGRDFAAGLSVFKRVGQPADIADVVAFVASDDARWITGQCIDVTGGSLLGASAT